MLTTAPVKAAAFSDEGGRQVVVPGSLKTPQAASRGRQEKRMNHMLPNPYTPARAMLV